MSAPTTTQLPQVRQALMLCMQSVVACAANLLPPSSPSHCAVLPWSHLHGPLPLATLVKHQEEAQRHM